MLRAWVWRGLLRLRWTSCSTAAQVTRLLRLWSVVLRGAQEGVSEKAAQGSRNGANLQGVQVPQQLCRKIAR
ncbi:unnamed protein product [Ectocarpus sp. CCAP 1310/34]|nr:unnamed protein product [Ectocarpus sp. CCAP 1310/34]